MQADDKTAKVRRRAYEIWETEGRPSGQEISHWLKAETECRSKEESPQGTLDRGSKKTMPQPKLSKTPRKKEMTKQPKA